jgi:hypothetical protein
MKIKEIIDALCNHEITKAQATEKIESIFDGCRINNSIEFQVVEVGEYHPSGLYYLKLRLPYEYSKIKDNVNSGDKVDVIFLPS